MYSIKRVLVALMAVLMIGLTLFSFVSLILAKIVVAVLLVVVIVVALTGRRPKRNTL